MNLRDPIGTYIYQDDKGLRYRVRLTKSIALAGGFEQSTNLTFQYPLLLKHSAMRMVEVFNPGKSKVLLVPIAYSNNLNYVFGGELVNPLELLFGWKVSNRYRERI